MYLENAKFDINTVVGKSTIIEYQVATMYEIVPVELDGFAPLVLIAFKEQGAAAFSKLRFVFKREILFHLVTREQYNELVKRTWNEAQVARTITSAEKKMYKAKIFKQDDISNDADGMQSTDLHQNISAMQLVDEIFSEAVTVKASDIHLEPEDDALAIRYRLDGVLHPAAIFPKSKQNEIISRIKILAHMDIAEKRRPQDGRILVEGNQKTIDVRVSSMPTVYGEKIVLRLLDKSQQPLELQSLGIVGETYVRFKEAIQKPHGMILVTGPTGSGKTTTLYAALKEILSPHINISTIEDPIEYKIAGINQTQVHSDIDYTFASAVRTFLRQDPDVIMVGEIRDPETAKYAIQAAQTGHLVFSTLHTNDAPGAVVRLLEMGVEPFLVASTVHLVLGQRLVRKTCTSCGRLRPVTHLEAEYLLKSRTNISQIFEGVGCAACAKTGYKGRIGVYECMPVSIAIQDLIIKRATTSKISECAIASGMRTLQDESVALVNKHLTTFEEIKNVVGF